MNKKAILLIFVFSLVVYANSLGGAFVWDDQSFVVNNMAIRSLDNVKYFFTDSSTTAVGELSRDVYRPITTLSYSIDFFLWGMNSFGYHLTNVIFHSLSGVLVFILLSLLFGNFLLALVGALIFVSHPIQTEVVSWISGRSSVLFMFFYLLSFILYIKSYSRTKVPYYLFSLLSFILAIFSKEMAATLPILLVLYDVYSSDKTSRAEKVLRYIPYGMILLFYMTTRLLIVRQVGQFAGWGSAYTTFLTMSKVLVSYIGDLFWPVRLCAVGYDIPLAKCILDPNVIFSISVIVAILAIFPYIYKRFRIASFGIAVFFITLLPVMNIIPIKALKAERFLYLPSLGLCIFAAFLVSIIVKKFYKPKYGKFSLVMLIPIVLIASYATGTMMRNEDWRDDLAIGKAAYRVYPTCAWTITALGENYMDRGNYAEAIKYLEKAVLLKKDYDLTRQILGTCYLKTGRYVDAVKEFKMTLMISPDSHPTVRNFMGVSYASMAQYDEAEKQFNLIVKIDPSFYNAYLNLGRIHEMEKRYDEAVKDYSKILIYAIDDYTRGVSYMRMGDAYSAEGDFAKARSSYKKSIVALGPRLEDLRSFVTKRLDNLPE